MRSLHEPDDNRVFLVGLVRLVKQPPLHLRVVAVQHEPPHNLDDLLINFFFMGAP